MSATLTVQGDTVAKGFSLFKCAIALRASDAGIQQRVASDEHNSLSQLFICKNQPHGTNLSIAVTAASLGCLEGVQPTSGDADTVEFFVDVGLFCEPGVVVWLITP